MRRVYVMGPQALKWVSDDLEGLEAIILYLCDTHLPSTVRCLSKEALARLQLINFIFPSL